MGLLVAHVLHPAATAILRRPGLPLSLCARARVHARVRVRVRVGPLVPRASLRLVLLLALLAAGVLFLGRGLLLVQHLQLLDERRVDGAPNVALDEGGVLVLELEPIQAVGALGRHLVRLVPRPDEAAARVVHRVHGLDVVPAPLARDHAGAVVRDPCQQPVHRVRVGVRHVRPLLRIVHDVEEVRVRVDHLRREERDRAVDRVGRLVPVELTRVDDELPWTMHQRRRVVPHRLRPVRE